MTRFGSREVLHILDVKPHVLRYWEQTLPLIRSQRDETGHRVWTGAQVRMLQRLRHLVVMRGMSVHAAGETILREGESAPGNVKAGLEAVRSELVATLQRLQESGRRSGDTAPIDGVAEHVTRGKSGSIGSVAEREGTTGSAGQDIVDLVAAKLAPPPRAAQEPLPARSEHDHPPPLSTARPLRAVRIVYRHLFAYSGHNSSVSRSVPEMLCRILEMRVASSTVPIIVCAPADHVEHFRNAFASWTGPELSVAPVPMITHRGGAWMSPLLSVVTALITDPDWQRRIASHRAEYAYLWAADNPDAPHMLIPSPAELTIPGLIMTVHPTKRRTLIGESLVLRLGDERLYHRVLACGRWSIGPVSTASDVERRSTGADTLQEGWRYDIRLRDLRVLEPVWYTVPRSAGPSLWRGSDWQSQMSAVWPEIGAME